MTVLSLLPGPRLEFPAQSLLDDAVQVARRVAYRAVPATNGPFVQNGLPLPALDLFQGEQGAGLLFPLQLEEGLGQFQGGVARAVLYVLLDYYL